MLKIEVGQVLLTPEQVASALNLSRRRVVTRMLRRELPWIKVGPRTLRLPAGALEAYLRDITGGAKE